MCWTVTGDPPFDSPSLSRTPTIFPLYLLRHVPFFHPPRPPLFSLIRKLYPSQAVTYIISLSWHNLLNSPLSFRSPSRSQLLKNLQVLPHFSSSFTRSRISLTSSHPDPWQAIGPAFPKSSSIAARFKAFLARSSRETEARVA